MKLVNKKTILLLIASSLTLGCTVPSESLIQAKPGELSNTSQADYGNVKFRFDFPAKFVPKITGFNTKAIENGKINRVKVKVESATTSFVIERSVELVPGGIEATLSLPLDKLYIVTVQGLNDTTPVSGADIKGFFSLMSAITVPVVEVNQVTTPVGKIIEALKAKFAAPATTGKPGAAATATPRPAGGTTTVVASASPAASASPGASASPAASASPGGLDTIATPEFKLANLDTAALVDVVSRARGSAHPSLINPTPFVDSIFTNKKVPVEVPDKALLKPGKVKGTISGLKYNETAIVTVNDPGSRQTIVVTPPQLNSVNDAAASIDPDKIAGDVSFVVDNVTPGAWTASIVASGYTVSGATATSGKVTVAAEAEVTSSFKLTSSAWLSAPNNLSGNIGTSDQSNLALDSIDNIHVTWRQDGFDTDTNSGVIFYSRWNGTSWTTQGVNVSQYNNSGLKGSRDPGVAVGLDRLPHLVWSAKDSAGNRKVYYNHFNGTTWQSPLAIPGSDNGISSSVTVDKNNGYLYAVWESANEIFLSQYDKNSWSNPIKVGNGNIPRVLMGTDGMAHIVWKSNNSQKLQYAGWSLAKGLTAVEDIPMSILGSDTQNVIDASMDRFNRLHLVWRNDIYIQYILRSNVSWSQSEIVNQIPNNLLIAKTGASISIAPTGIVNVAWASSTKDNKEVIRFRRRLSDGWKKPFEKIVNPNEAVTDTTGTTKTPTTTTTTTTTVKYSENIDGYEDIPLSYISSVEGKPLIVADNLGKIHVMWSNRGTNSNDTDLLHSVKTSTATTK